MSTGMTGIVPVHTWGEKVCPNIVFCTTCKGRAHHIEKTLPKNMADNAAYRNLTFLILDYNSNDGLEEYLKRTQAAALASGRLVVYKYPAPWPFRMSHAKNLAHRLGILNRADVLVNLDADNYTGEGFAEFIAQKYEADPVNLFLWANAKSVIGRARQGLAGRIAVSRNLFLKVGGYNEQFITWAPEDEDLKCRIRRLGYVGEEIPTKYLYVIGHRDGLRFREYPHAKPTVESEAAEIQRIRSATHTIANHGKFGCGVVFRNFAPEPIELTPVPTRIFGIGMHKTATTSLFTAFRELGFDSAHWTTPRWARDVWESMVAEGRSLLLEQHYAISDLPLTLLYKHLDKAYPGSKFILTIRSEAAWIESVRTHWEVNSQRFEWDNDCFSHRCHQLLYGRKTFDADVMLNRYRQHNTEVQEHFRDRSDDLLVFDVEKAGWPELCAFLRQRIPNVPYPKAFSTKAAGVGDGK